MPNPHGDFIWYQLGTPDPAGAAAFYSAVLGWSVRSFDGTPDGYRVASIDGVDVAGIAGPPPLPAFAGRPPAWLGYVGVDDVDAATPAVVAAGGQALIPPTDIPGVGRFSLVADPQGLPFYLMRGASPEASRAFAPGVAGHCQWNELATTDPAGALAFFGGQFGWRPGTAMPMGPLGTYQLVTHHGRDIGAILPVPPEAPGPVWTFYFGVADIDAAAAQVAASGGMVHHGPMEVPGGVFIIVATDPQGALFGTVGPRVAAT